MKARGGPRSRNLTRSLLRQPWLNKDRKLGIGSAHPEPAGSVINARPRFGNPDWRKRVHRSSHKNIVILLLYRDIEVGFSQPTRTRTRRRPSPSLSLHGSTSITLGVPDVEAVRRYWLEFGRRTARGAPANDMKGGHCEQHA
jgi:hypothetical protein